MGNSIAYCDDCTEQSHLKPYEYIEQEINKNEYTRSNHKYRKN